MPRSQSHLYSIAATAGALLSVSFGASADHSSPQWSQGQLVIQGAGCPIETPDGLSLMVASGRPGGHGVPPDLDIWVIDRAAIGAEWSPPKNLPEPINSASPDFCPAPFERSLYFVSAKPNPDACGGGGGGGDIYLSRQSPAGDWSEPVHLPCAPDGPNTPGTERSPSFIETWYGTFLFFSTNGGVAGAKEDIYVSIMNRKGEFGPGHLVQALSTPDEDQMPTVRALNGAFEVTFNSDRPGAIGGQGQDAYHARALFLPFWWSKPQNLGPNVNTPANETRASLSWDGKRLYVGRGDVYMSERQ
jgi:WD40-like Beta Propeller Repeat